MGVQIALKLGKSNLEGIINVCKVHSSDNNGYFVTVLTLFGKKNRKHPFLRTSNKFSSRDIITFYIPAIFINFKMDIKSKQSVSVPESRPGNMMPYPDPHFIFRWKI
jgi:hypothetical protein